ncbi:hypothetical protein PR003_g9706 [Phytophthora rubi]|uniref:Pectate lyase n=1 Tax=Phytophthora rubi TaxID=129364 RepID=A0A6A4FG09_9STRA|nr:hypothetical protein PR002_g7577 [Phytophthora rubi]KAE9341969.1 hypothetical protein PR003_g9706 [Phytophthora rubi]
MTGANVILIIGFAISNAAENGDDWNWFLSKTSEALPCISNLADLFFMSDRDKGITPSVRRVPVGAPFSMCGTHQTECD